MKTNRKHGFTVVELVVVIAIIAVLAAVLIPTFTSIIKKANDSAYLQERTNQKIEDLAEKVDKINYFTWEDFEKKLADELAKVGSADTDEIKKAVEAAMKEYSAHSQTSMTGLTEAQVKKIVDEAMAGQLTSAQVEAIVNQAIKNANLTPGTSGGLTEAQVKQIINSAVAGIKQTGVTKAEMQKAIKDALSGVTGISDADIEKALAAFGVSTLTEADINSIISSATSDNTTLAKALNIRLANLGVGKQKTVYDMVVKIGGESVITGTNTTSTVSDSSSTLLYDLDSNKFFTVDKDGKVDYDGGLSLSDPLTDAYKYWIFADSVDTTYSTYLLRGSTLTSATVSTGIDVGENTEVTSITYTNSVSAQDVVIRTNSASTELVVNAPYDTVKHYDAVGQVHVIAVDKNNCYEENGKAAFTQVDSGKYKTTSTADVELLFVSDVAKVKVELAAGTVEHAHAISEAEANTINGTNPGVVFDYDGNGAQSELDVYHHVNDGDKIGLTVDYNNNKTKETIIDIVEDAVEKEAIEADESDFWIVCHADAFAAGSGTELDPYIIKTARQLSLLAYNVNTLQAGYASAYYRLEKDIDLRGKAWTPIGTTNGATTVYFTGHFDGNGHSIIGLTNNDKTDVELGLYRDELSSVKGLAATYGLFGFVKDAEFNRVVIKNANIDGSSHFKQSGFIAGVAEGNITMTNCSVDSLSSLKGLSKVGGLIGEYINYGTGMNDKLGTFTNCSFAGSITATDRAGAIIGAVKTNANNLYQFNQCVSTGSLTVENYGVGLIGFKYQGSEGERIEFPTFEYTECSIDLSKLTASMGKGKYIGSIQHKTMLIIDSEYDNLAFGEIRFAGSEVALVFNDDMYMFRGSMNDVLPEISSLSETTYDIGQFWYHSNPTTWDALTSYGSNMISKSGSFFVKINQSSFAIENSKIKVKGGELKLDTASISLDEINSKFIADGYVATLNQEGNSTTLKGYIVNHSE